MKLATSAVICLVALSLAGCTAASASGPTRSAAQHNTPTASPPLAVVDGLPTSCHAFYSGLTTFVSPDGSLVLNPAWRSGPGVARAQASGYGTYDPTLAPMLSHNPGLICDWAPAKGPTDTFLTTQFRHVGAATENAVLALLNKSNLFCSEAYGGEWCLTNDSHTGRSIGESQFLGHGDWIASNWNNAGPETYTPRLLQVLFE